MDVEHPERDQAWDEVTRHETESQRLDRNWAHLLQELRVAQTGAQLVTGFLLTLPFQPRFNSLSQIMKDVYLATIGCSIASTLLLVAPVAMHRVLFRQHRLVTLVSTTHWFAIAGVVLLGLTLVGVAIVIFDIVAGSSAGWIAGGCVAAAMVFLWLLLPGFQRATDDKSPQQH